MSISELIINIIRDIHETIQYLPASILVGFLGLPGWPYYRKRENGKRDFVAFILLLVFISLILHIAYFSREPGSRNGIDIIPFSTWGDTAVSRAYVIENVILFIPFGCLLPFAIPLFRKWQWSLYAHLGFSCGLEFMQMITKRGYCQTDDILTNALGGMIGFGLFRLLAYKDRRVKLVMVMVWMALIFSFSAKEADQSTLESQSMGRLIARVFVPGFEQWDSGRQQELVEKMDYFVRKSAHFIEYVILGILWTFYWEGKKRKSFLCGSLYAITDEIHQLFVDGRSCQFTDMLLDSAGVATGVVLMVLFCHLTESLRESGIRND